MGHGRTRPGQVPIPPLTQASPIHGPRHVLRGTPPSDEIWKSYLCAHPSCDSDAPTTCPSCPSAPETFQHAILHSSAKAPSRTRYLQGVLDIGPGAPVWSLAALLGALARYIKSTATAFPLVMFSRRTSVASSISSRSSIVVSLRYFMSLRESSVYILVFHAVR